MRENKQNKTKTEKGYVQSHRLRRVVKNVTIYNYAELSYYQRQIYVYMYIYNLLFHIDIILFRYKFHVYSNLDINTADMENGIRRAVRYKYTCAIVTIQYLIEVNFTCFTIERTHIEHN